MSERVLKEKTSGRRSAGRPRRFTHEQIVQAALDVMEREGYAALTARALASELGIVPSVLFNYFECIEDIEGQALQRLAASIPMPRPSPPKALRQQTIDCLMIVRDLLLKHPGVLHPPLGSPALETFRESIVQWVLALAPFAASPQAAAIGHSALLNAVARSAEIERHYGLEIVSNIKRLHDPRLPPPVNLRESLDHLLDSLFPLLPKSR